MLRREAMATTACVCQSRLVSQPELSWIISRSGRQGPRKTAPRILRASAHLWANHPCVWWVPSCFCFLFSLLIVRVSNECFCTFSLRILLMWRSWSYFLTPPLLVSFCLFRTLLCCSNPYFSPLLLFYSEKNSSSVVTFTGKGISRPASASGRDTLKIGEVRRTLLSDLLPFVHLFTHPLNCLSNRPRRAIAEYLVECLNQR